MNRMSMPSWDRIKAVFAEACELPAEQVPAFLDRVCEGDAELRREMEALLAARSGKQVATGGAARELAAASTMRSAIITEGAGTIIGPYKLLQSIGEGGFGSVFLAEQTQPVRRRVAVKIIKLGMDTKQVIARFEAERQALALMDHPHIAKVLDGGATPLTERGGGRPYFVMEYVVGDAITAFADAHKLTIRNRLDLFQQVCSAVQHAHTKGIIHRDLKPGNVLVTMVDGKPFAKVIDFGIAKATAGPGGLTDKTLFTEHRQLIGTPEYMSPEQAEGSPDIDTRTDVYALGVLLYELLTGQTPFDGARLRSAAYAEIQRIIKDEEPPSPSQRLSRSLDTIAATAAARQMEPEKLRASVHGELDWIVMRALDKERGRRYESANALADDVRRHLAGEAVVAAPVSRVYRLRKFVRKNRGPVGAVGAVMLALAAGLSVAAWQWQRQLTTNRVLNELTDAAERGFDEATRAYTGTRNAFAFREMDDGEGGKTVVLTNESPLPGVPAPNSTSNRHWKLNMLIDSAISRGREARLRREQLELQTNSVRRALSNMFEAGMSSQVGQQRGLPVLPEIRGEPGFKLSPYLDASSRTENGWEFRFNKFDTHSQTSVPLNDEQLLSALADSATLTLTRALEIADEAEWSAYAANLALAQAAMGSWDFPDARRAVNRTPQAKRGWEFRFVFAKSASIAVRVPGGGDVRFDTPDGFTVLGRPSSGTPTRLFHYSLPDGALLGTAELSISDELSGGTNAGEKVVMIRGSEALAHRELAAFRHPQYVAAATPGRQAGDWLVQPGPERSRLVVQEPLARVVWDGVSREFSGCGQPTQSTDGEWIALNQFDMTYHDIVVLRTNQLGGPERRLDLSWDQPELRIAAILSSSPNGSSGITITTPDGTRRIVGGNDKTVRFYEAKDGKPTLPATAESPEGVYREVAVFRMPDAVTNLQMTGDGTRLIIHLQDGSARVWDIRDPEERRKDLQAEWAERVPAGAYLDALWASDTPDEKLQYAVMNDASLTPLRRLVAAEMLEERLEDDRIAAEQAFAAVTRDQTEGTAVQAAAAARTNLPKRVHTRLIAKVTAWVYKPTEPSDAERLAAEVTRRRLAEADASMAATSFGSVEFMRAQAPKVIAAFETRMELLGCNDRGTIEALVSVARYVGSVEALAAAIQLIECEASDDVSILAIVARLRSELAASSPATLWAAGEIDMKADATIKAPLTADEHRQRAREALARAKALMKPAADGTPSPWANDEDAKALIAEAEALIGGAP